MTDETTKSELNSHFSPRGGSLQPDVLVELSSILNLHDLTPQDLFYKWESYSIKMGLEASAGSKMDAKMARDFKRDITDAVEREARQRSGAGKGVSERRSAAAMKTPRNKAAGGDMFGMIDGVTSSIGRPTPKQQTNGTTKRKSDYETPNRPSTTSNKSAKPHRGSSPSNGTSLSAAVQGHSNIPFSDRPDPGAILQTLNDSIPIPEPRSAPSQEPRVSLKSNTDMKKFEYKTAGMKPSEASEILDDRIDQFIELVQSTHALEDTEFGNPAVQSQNEIVAVGRIASDTSEARLTTGSIVLETSRRGGAGLRVPLELKEDGPAFEFFPGKIVALRGKNASGEKFRVSEVLETPPLPPSASSIVELQAHNSRLEASSSDHVDGMNAEEADHQTSEAPSSNSPQPLNILLASGPYTHDENLTYEPLHALIDRAVSTTPDAIILLGPFLDIEHPLVSSGRFPSSVFSGANAKHLNPDTATLTDVFRVLVSTPLQRLCAALPSTTVIMIPSLRDATSRHAAFPQDRLSKKNLALPNQCKITTNPVTLSLNEVRMALSSHDVLFELKQAECVGGQKPTTDPITRIARYLLSQRHFYPLFPPPNRSSLPRPAPAFPPTAAPNGTAGHDTAHDSTSLDAYAPPVANGTTPPTATGPNLDISYTSLLEWQNARPDVLIAPSAALPPFIKVVDSVVCVNPGVAAPRARGKQGACAQMYVNPKDVGGLGTDVEDAAHDVWERGRVDILRV